MTEMMVVLAPFLLGFLAGCFTVANWRGVMHDHRVKGGQVPNGWLLGLGKDFKDAKRKVGGE